MDSLPVEILTHILIHLPPTERIRLERVSKSWRKASRNTWSRTKKLDIRVDYEDKRREVDRSKNVMYCENQTLVIHTDNPRVFHNITIRIKQYITCINLELPGSRNSEKILMIIAQHFHKVEVLAYQTEFFNSNIFSRIIKGNEQLHSLKCLNWEGNLQTLPIRNWRSLHFQPIVNNVKIWENVIIPMVDNSRSLQDFEMLGLWSSNVMEALLKQKYLKCLSIKSIYQKELPNYILEIPRLKNLETLRLVALENIGDDVIVNLLKGLAQNGRSLQELQILCDRISIEALDVIATLPQLITLNLEFGSLTDEHLIRLPCCKHLAICLNYPYDELITYTDNGLIQMIKNAGELETLDISDLEVSPKMFKKLLFETENRQTSIEIKVSQDMFDELTVICRNSRIRIIEGVMKRICFR